MTFSSISGLVLCSPMVGYMTAEEFHMIGSSVSSKEKLVSRTDRTISVIVVRQNQQEATDLTDYALISS